MIKSCQQCGVEFNAPKKITKFCSYHCSMVWRNANVGHPRPMKTHGLSGTSEHKVWKHIRQRCNNPKNKNYDRYGERGIKVCERWDSFENFLEDMGQRPSGYEIDRIDNDGNYCPENCRWASRSEQRQNMPDNVNWTFNGKTQCVTAWAQELGIPESALWHRRQRGWTVERALTQPLRITKKTQENLGS